MAFFCLFYIFGQLLITVWIFPNVITNGCRNLFDVERN